MALNIATANDVTNEATTSAVGGHETDINPVMVDVRHRG
jgi:hypothetical protein